MKAVHHRDGERRVSEAPCIHLAPRAVQHRAVQQSNENTDVVNTGSDTVNLRRPSSVVTIDAVSTCHDNINLHRPTSAVTIYAVNTGRATGKATSPYSGRRDDGRVVRIELGSGFGAEGVVQHAGAAGQQGRKCDFVAA